MVKLNVIDLASIQDCLSAYKKLIDWIPPVGELEVEMKEERIKIINYLLRKTEAIIRKEADRNE